MNNLDIDELKIDNIERINYKDYLNKKIYKFCLEINKNIINEELENIKLLPEKIKNNITELNINKEIINNQILKLDIKHEKLSTDLPKINSKINELEANLIKEENKPFDKKDTFSTLKVLIMRLLI
jgi:hypothetical protein